MKVFFDTEFTGLQKSTSLISIGLVSENGKHFYAEFNDYNEFQVNDWIKENVINHLYCKTNDKQNIFGSNYHYGDKYKIANELREWLKQFDYVELYSDVCHYDMVLLIDLFGSAQDLPENVCPACYDINQDIKEYFNLSTLQQAFDMSREDILGNLNIHINGEKHNAIYDAIVIAAIYNNIHSH